MQILLTLEIKMSFSFSGLTNYLPTQTQILNAASQTRDGVIWAASQTRDGVMSGATAFGAFAHHRYTNLTEGIETARVIDTLLPQAIWEDIQPTYVAVDGIVRPLLNQAVTTVRPLLTAAYSTAGTYAIAGLGSIQTNGLALLARVQAQIAALRS